MNIVTASGCASGGGRTGAGVGAGTNVGPTALPTATEIQVGGVSTVAIQFTMRSGGGDPADHSASCSPCSRIAASTALPTSLSTYSLRV